MIPQDALCECGHEKSNHAFDYLNRVREDFCRKCIKYYDNSEKEEYLHLFKWNKPVPDELI